MPDPPLRARRRYGECARRRQGGLRDRGVPPYDPDMVARDEERERRLAAALRDNLKRRKAQSREAAAGTEPAAAATPPPERT
jgi:hypothetical protein